VTTASYVHAVGSVRDLLKRWRVGLLLVYVAVAVLVLPRLAQQRLDQERLTQLAAGAMCTGHVPGASADGRRGPGEVQPILDRH